MSRVGPEGRLAGKINRLIDMGEMNLLLGALFGLTDEESPAADADSNAGKGVH